MKVIINTANNFKGCNGIELDVIEISGTRISVDIPRYGFNASKEPVGNFGTTADFNIKEVHSFAMNTYKRD